MPSRNNPPSTENSVSITDRVLMECSPTPMGLETRPGRASGKQTLPPLQSSLSSSSSSSMPLVAGAQIAGDVGACDVDDELEALASEYMQAASSSHLSMDVDIRNAFKSPGAVAGLGSKMAAGSYAPGQRHDIPSTSPISWQRGQLLGAGSFGRVYFGLNSSTGELMAVKQIKYAPGQPTDVTRQAAMALQCEVRCLQTLHHPNIVRYLGVERDDVNGVISICLEYCAGGSIASLLDKFGPFNEALTRSYMRMILAGLTFLHTRPGG